MTWLNFFFMLKCDWPSLAKGVPLLSVGGNRIPFLLHTIHSAPGNGICLNVATYFYKMSEDNLRLLKNFG